MKYLLTVLIRKAPYNFAKISALICVEGSHPDVVFHKFLQWCYSGIQDTFTCTEGPPQLRYTAARPEM